MAQQRHRHRGAKHVAWRLGSGGAWRVATAKAKASRGIALGI
jgi:hypothetical protein